MPECLCHLHPTRERSKNQVVPTAMCSGLSALSVALLTCNICAHSRSLALRTLRTSGSPNFVADFVVEISHPVR